MTENKVEKIDVAAREELVARVQGLVDRVDYRGDDYGFIVGVTEGMKYPFVQVWHERTCILAGEVGVGKGGKAYITQYATDSEIFQTLFGLAKSYEEHEVRETFLVDGARVFGPHIKTSALAQVAEDTDYRD